MRIIALDGMDYTGKSTQAENLKTHFESQGLKTIILHPPGGGEYGDEIYDLTFNKWKKNISNKTRFYLFMSTQQNLYDTVLPKAKSNGVDVVILDRCLVSSLVYQCKQENNQDYQETINILSEMSSSYPIDDLIIFDLDIDTLKKRKAKRLGKADEVYDDKPVEWYEGLRKSYYEVHTDMVSGHFFKRSLFDQFDGNEQDVYRRLLIELGEMCDESNVPGSN